MILYLFDQEGKQRGKESEMSKMVVIKNPRESRN